MLALGAGAAGLALLGGCGDDDATPDDDQPAGPPQLTERPEARDRAPQGIVRLGSTVEPSDRLTRAERLLAYSRLVALDPRSGDIYGDLARTVELDEPLSAVFTLDPTARFHAGADGTALPVTAEAIAEDFARREAAEEFLFSRAVGDVEVIDPLTLRLRLRGPFSLLFELLADPEAASVRRTMTYVRFREPLGSGPFAPAGWDDVGSVLVANPLYHHEAYPRLERIGFLRYRDESMLRTAFGGGDLDVAPAAEARSDDPGAQRSDAVAQERPARRLRGLGLSMLGEKGSVSVRHVAAFADERVRRAVSLAIDREAIAALDGSIIAGPVGPAHATDRLSPEELADHPLYEHDPAEARSLLEAAGVPDLAFRIEFPTLAGLRPIGLALVEQLNDAGFRPVLMPRELEAWAPQFRAGDFEATLFEVSDLVTPDLELRLHTTGGLDGRFSPWGYSNPLYDAAVREALSAVEPAERARLARRAQRLLLDQVPAMFPLNAPVERAHVARSLRGYEFDAYDFNLAWLAAGWEHAST